MSLFLETLRAIQKSKKHNTGVRKVVLATPAKIYKTHTQTCLQMGDFISRRLSGGPWGAPAAPRRLLILNEPAALPKRPQGPGITLKKNPTNATSVPKSAPEHKFIGDSSTEPQIWTSGPADCAKRFQ